MHAARPQLSSGPRTVRLLAPDGTQDQIPRCCRADHPRPRWSGLVRAAVAPYPALRRRRQRRQSRPHRACRSPLGRRTIPDTSPADGRGPSDDGRGPSDDLDINAGTGLDRNFATSRPPAQRAGRNRGSSTHAGDAQFCSSRSCIPNFPNGTGTVVQCVDGEYSHSGGLSGACSHHGGES